MAKNHVLDIILGLKDKTSGGLKTIGGNLKSFGANVKKAFNSAPVRAFRRAVLGVTAAFIGAIVEAAKFNVQMARVWTMAGGGINSFKELREQARGLASDFGLARSEIASGMYNALSAGIDKANLEGFMTQAAKVAVADGSDISTAVDGITTVLNAFKIEATKTEEISDKLFKTVALGKTTFGELSRSLATVAPVAAASNIPLEQILAHVAGLTAQGTPTAQAMTQIRASIIGLNKALGDGWSDTMSYQEALKAVWKQSGESQTALLKLVGSTEAVQAVLGGVGINAEMAAEKLDGMSDSAGAAQEAFEKVNQFRHWPTLLETARGTLSKFGEYVDERLAPYVTRVTEQLREWRDDAALWEKIGAFLDKGEAKLADIAAWLSNIKSLEDLKMAGVELGQKFTDYVVEKAKDIGAAMAEGMWDGVKGMAKGGVTGAGQGVADFFTLGQASKIEAGEKPSMNPFTLMKDWLGFSGGKESSGESVAASVKEGAKQGVQEAIAEQPKEDTSGSANQLADLTGEQSSPSSAYNDPANKADRYQRMADQLGDSPEGEAAQEMADEARQKAEETLGKVSALSETTASLAGLSNESLAVIQKSNTETLSILDILNRNSSDMVMALGSVHSQVNSVSAKLTMLERKVSSNAAAVREQRS